MLIVKHHSPKIDSGVRLLEEQCYSTKEMANELGMSPRTIFNYPKDLGLTIRIGRLASLKDTPPQGLCLPSEDPNTKGLNPEKMIKENITKKHVKDISEKLATLTVEHDLEMRKIVVALEKHTAIFESVEQMGMPREEFIDVAIEIGYKELKDVYLKKVREQEEKKAMQEFLEIRKFINSMR